MRIALLVSVLTLAGETNAFVPLSTTDRFSTELGPTGGYLSSLGDTPIRQFHREQNEREILGGTLINESQRLEQSTFPIPPEALVEMTKDAISRGLGTEDPTILAENFEFCGPVVGPLSKDEYLGALKSYKLLEAFPDLDNRYYNFHCDPFEFNRVWYSVRPLATHTGMLFGKQPSGKQLELPPQTHSVKFNEDGYITEITIGYVLDRREGNTGGLGGAFGFFYGVGQPLSIPECKPYKKSMRFRVMTGVGKLGRKLRKD